MHGLDSLERLNAQADAEYLRKKANNTASELKVFPSIKLYPNPHATMKRILDGAKG